MCAATRSPVLRDENNGENSSKSKNAATPAGLRIKLNGAEEKLM